MRQAVFKTLYISLCALLFPIQLMAMSSLAHLDVQILEVTPCPVKSGQLVTACLRVSASFGTKDFCDQCGDNTIKNIQVTLKLLGGGFLVSGEPDQGIFRIIAGNQAIWKVGELKVGQSTELKFQYRSGLIENVICAKAQALRTKTTSTTFKCGVKGGCVARSTSASICQDSLLELPLSAIARFTPPATVKIQNAPAHGTVVIRNNGSFDPTIVYTPDVGFVGVDSFTYQFKDGDDCLSNKATITVKVFEDVIDARNAERNTCQNNAVSIDVRTIADFATTPTISIFNGPNNGQASVEDLIITYVPNQDFLGTDMFDYSVTDICGTATATITINVLQAPQTQPVVATTCVNNPVTIPVSDAVEFVGTPSVVIIAGPSNGQASVVGDLLFIYTPNQNFVGQDSFMYRITDDCGTSTGTVTINVIPPPVANPDLAITCINNPVIIDVLANDTQLNNPVVTIVTPPIKGSALVNPDNTITYNPQGGIPVVVPEEILFTYQVCNTNSCCDTAQVTVQVGATPVAHNDFISTCSSGTIAIPVLNNDISAAPVTLMIVSQPASGSATVTINADNTITYNPNGFVGSDSFTYRFSDETGCFSNVATVSVIVENKPCPFPLPDMGKVCQGQQTTICVLCNDEDILPTATVTITRQPSRGQAIVNVNKTITYTPEPSFSGIDTFVYEVCNNGFCCSAQVTMQVFPACAAQQIVAHITQDTQLIIDVLSNQDQIPEPTVSIITQPQHGVATVNDDGTITYTPQTNFIGVDQLTYQLCNANNCCCQADIIITVQPKPQTIDDCFVTCRSAAIEIPVIIDPQFVPPFLVFIITQPTSGRATAIVNQSQPQTITYTPQSDFCGDDVFIYQICDSQGRCNNVRVSVTVLFGPIIQNKTETTCKNQPKVIEIGSESIGAIKRQPTECVIEAPMLTISTAPLHGVATVNADLTITYIPNINFTGIDQFTVQGCFSDSCCDEATITVRVNGAENDRVNTSMGGSTTINVLVNDTFTPPAIVTVTDGPSNGTTIVNVNGSITYTPNVGFSGTDIFVYQLEDGAGCKSTATVTVTVSSMRCPVAVADRVDACQTIPVVINVFANDQNINPSDTLSIISQPTSGTAQVQINPNKTITYVQTDTNFVGIDNFIYQVCNIENCCSSAPVMINVGKQPRVMNDTAFTCKDNSRVIDVLANDKNLQNPTVVIQTAPMNGAAIINPNNSITYIPNSMFMGSDSLIYRVMNDNNCFATGMLSIITTTSPVGTTDMVVVNQGAPTVINVLANDIFVPPAQLTILTQPSNGTAVVIPGSTPTILYTPNILFTGTDLFTYQVCDATGCCSGPVMVTITVVPAPVAQMACQAIPVNTPTLIFLNNFIIGGTAPVVCSIVTPPMHGLLTFQSNCTYLYSPDQGFRGLDMFTYQVTDANGRTSQAMFTITVGPGDPFVNALQNAFCPICTGGD